MKIKDLLIQACFMGLVIVVTMFIAIPAGSLGYLNLGDVVIMLAASFLNPLSMVFVAGVGSFLADLFAGYGQYMFFTLVIKAAEGVLVAYLIQRFKWKSYYAFAVGALVMVTGYAVTEVILSGTINMFTVGFVVNLNQGLAACLGATLLYPLIKNSWKGFVNEAK